MNLRRRRRARRVSLALSALAAAAWLFSVFCITWWSSRPYATNLWTVGNFPVSHQHQIYVGNGALAISNRSVSRPGWSFHLGGPAPMIWLPSVESAADPIGNSRMRVSVVIPLWIPLALTLPPLLLTHARVRRPLTRLRRGLCHRCAYDLNSTPPEKHCPECGSPRLALPQRQGRPARTPT